MSAIDCGAVQVTHQFPNKYIFSRVSKILCSSSVAFIADYNSRFVDILYVYSAKILYVIQTPTLTLLLWLTPLRLKCNT